MRFFPPVIPLRGCRALGPLLFWSVLLSACIHGPVPDSSREFREDLWEEIRGRAVPEWRKIPSPEDGNQEDSAEDRYREHYGFGEFERTSGAFHGIGLLDGEEPPIGIQYLIPRGQGRGTVFLAHGYLDHSGSHRRIIQVLGETGFSVVAWDLPGHGFSGGPRGDIGDFQDYGEAAARVIRAFSGSPSGTELKDADPDLTEGGDGNEAFFPRPWIALGHSTGAAAYFILLQRFYGAGKPSPFHRVVFINPLIRPVRWRLSLLGLQLFGWAVQNLRPWGEQDSLLGVEVLPLSWVRRLRDWQGQLSGYQELPQKGLILQGTRDKVVDYRYNLPFLMQMVPGLEVEYVEEAGHVPYTETAANRRILEILIHYLVEGE